MTQMLHEKYYLDLITIFRQMPDPGKKPTKGKKRPVNFFLFEGAHAGERLDGAIRVAADHLYTREVFTQWDTHVSLGLWRWSQMAKCWGMRHGGSDLWMVFEGWRTIGGVLPASMRLEQSSTFPSAYLKASYAFEGTWGRNCAIMVLCHNGSMRQHVVAMSKKRTWKGQETRIRK